MDGVEATVSIAGYDLTNGAMRSDIGTIFCVLKPWEERTTKETSLLYIATKAKESFDRDIPNAVAIPFNAPAIPGISATGGFEFEILDTADLGLHTLSEVTRELIQKAKSRPELGPLSSFFSDDTPQLYVDIDRDKVKKSGSLP